VTQVVDASVVFAALVDSGPNGEWAETIVSAGPLLAPHLLPVEVASVLRRSVSAALLSPDVAALAHADLLDLPIELVPYGPAAHRVWELRENLTAYDAWYVATAELFDVPMATLDRRLARASGPTCAFLTPPGRS
jgi:predicted nucleic acid-binding protein